jgi:hypothetical protein
MYFKAACSTFAIADALFVSIVLVAVYTMAGTGVDFGNPNDFRHLGTVPGRPSWRHASFLIHIKYLCFSLNSVFEDKTYSTRIDSEIE